jgi:hypothetical protein
MVKKEIASNCSRRMSAEEVAAIRSALKAEGIPIYPDRIRAGPANAAVMKKAKPRHTSVSRR